MVCDKAKEIVAEIKSTNEKLVENFSSMLIAAIQCIVFHKQSCLTTKATSN